MKYLAAFLAGAGGGAEGEYLQNLQNPNMRHREGLNSGVHDPQGTYETYGTRGPGEDDDRGVDPKWLAELNALIGRAQPDE